MIGWAEVLMLFVGSVWIVAIVACALSCLYEGVIWLWRRSQRDKSIRNSYS